MGFDHAETHTTNMSTRLLYFTRQRYQLVEYAGSCKVVDERPYWWRTFDYKIQSDYCCLFLAPPLCHRYVLPPRRRSPPFLSPTLNQAPIAGGISQEKGCVDLWSVTSRTQNLPILIFVLRHRVRSPDILRRPQVLPARTVLTCMLRLYNALGLYHR